MNDLGIDVLLLNAILHIATTIYAYHKHRRISLYVMIWIAYSIVTTMGYVITAILDIHYSNDSSLGMHVPFEPYIFAYLTTLLLTSPFYNMDMSNISFENLQGNNVNTIARLLTWVFAIRFALSIAVLFFVLEYIGLGNAYLFSHEGGGSIMSSFGPLAQKYMWISSMVSGMFLPLYVVYHFQRLIYDIGSSISNLLCIIIAFAPEVVMSIASGSKGQLFFVAFNILFYYFIFRQHLSSKVQHYLKIGCIGVGILFVSWTFVITASRLDVMGSNIEESEQIFRYIGEPYPNLTWQYYGQVKDHPYGRRFFPEFFSPNPEKLYAQGIDGKFDYWAPKTGVNMAYLKTFWGDWYLEFGFGGSFFAILALYFICRKLFLDKYWLLSNFSLVAFYYTRIIIQGCFTGAGIEGSAHHQTILGLFILGFFIKNSIEKTKA